MNHKTMMMATTARFLRAPDGAEGGGSADPAPAATVDAGGAADTVAAGGGADSVAGAEATGGAAGDSIQGGAGGDKIDGLLGKGGEAKPEGDAKPEAPTVPEKYEIKLEGDAQVDAGILEAATPVLKELGLGNDQATKLAGLLQTSILPKLTEQITAQANQATAESIVEQAKTWAAEAVADPDLGGGKVETLNENLVHAARFRDEFGSPELTKFLTESALGNHPLLIKAFVNAGKALAEGNFHTSDKGAQAKVDDGTLFYGDAFKKKDAAA